MLPTSSIPILSQEQAIERLKDLPRPWASDYLSMYSNWLGGITREPWLMSVPVDDHLVHRGDGVFEAMKCIEGRIYQLDAHLARLARSAAAIHLELPHPPEVMKDLAAATVRAGGEKNCMVRIYISRGPGGFSTNPYECPARGVYIVASLIHPPAGEAYEKGVNLGISHVPAKSGFFASVKSCNYLPNVLLKREAVESGWDFALGLDENGGLAEGSTENFGLVDQKGRLVFPPPDHILEGTTARRAVELAGRLVDEGLLSGLDRRPLSMDDLFSAREVMLFGTTLDVLPATRLGGRELGGGQVGPVARRLLELMRRDILENPATSTPAFD